MCRARSLPPQDHEKSLAPVSLMTSAPTKLPVVTREAVGFGLMAAAAVAAVMISVASEQGYGFLLRSDAQNFYRVALDPFGDGHIFAGSDAWTGTAYRYGR